MNSYTLGISGSWWIYALLVLLASGLAFWTYKQTNPPLSTSRRALLFTLRTVALSLLLFALFEPVLTMIRASLTRPRLAVIIDKSLSMSLNDGKVNRANAIKTAINASNISSLNADDIEFVTFSENAKGNYVALSSVDSIPAKGLYTNISNAIKFLNDASEDDVVNAAILFTDGALNAGANPLYETEYFGKPIFTVGIGDSTDPRDVSVQSVLANEIVYVGTNVPVSVTVKAAGFPDNTNAQVTLLDNGSVIGKQTITIARNVPTYSVSFSMKPSQPGIHKLTSRVESLGNELTTKNNELSEFITVIKQKRKIALFAGSPSPDITFVKTVLETIPDAEIQTYIQKQGSEFYNPAPTAQSVNDAEAIILIGFPIAQTPMPILQLIAKEAEKGKPIFFIASQNLDYQKLKPLEPYLPFSVSSSSSQEYLAAPDIQEGGLSSPIMKITGTDKDKSIWNELPPIYKTETFIDVKPESEILSTIRIGTSTVPEPLIMSRTFAGKKSLAVLGYGIYRWKLMGSAPEAARGMKDIPDVLGSFVDQGLQWLGASEKEKLVKIRSVRKFYTAGERVEFMGQVYNAALDPIDNAEVSVMVQGGGGKRELRLANMGNGVYSGSISGLPSADYFYTGIAKQGKELGKDEGRFTVGTESAEYQNLTMNAPLLRTMAERSGGAFYTPSNVSKFLEDLKKHPRFTETSTTKESEIPLWNYVWLLAFALLCFATEWFMRKRSGLI